MSLSDNRVRAGLTVVVLLACGAVGWSLFGSDSSPAPALTDAASPAPPAGPDLSVEALKKAEPVEVMKLFRREDLTEEQRETLFRNAREVREKMMKERMSRYFSAQGEARTAILDEQIDEFLAMRKRMEEAREEGPSEEERQRMRERWRNRSPPSREERKENFETAKAEDRSRMMGYFMAVRARMQERGMEMPRGPGGHGGPGMRGGPRGGRPAGGDSGNRSSGGRGSRNR